jgi:8-oxo-dGTP diphosphatase
MNNYCYEYPRPALTVDSIIFSFLEQKLNILLIKRASEPFINCWAFPGGFVNEGELVEQAAQRELNEETGVKDIPLDPFYTASEPGRDPRGWTVSVIFLGYVSGKEIVPVAGDDAKEAAWYPVRELPPMAFDHDKIVQNAMTYLLNKVRYFPLARLLLKESFTTDDLIKLGLELGIKLDDLHFRLNKFKQSGLIVDSSKKDQLCFNNVRFEGLK